MTATKAWIQYDSPAESERAAATRQGLVYVDISPKRDNHIAVWLPGGRRNNDASAKKIEEMGGHWRQNWGFYYLPLTVTNAKELEVWFGKRFEPSERFDDWVFDQIEKLHSLDNMSSANSDAQLSERFAKEAPIIARMAHPYQRAGIAFGALTKRYGLFDQPGLGKTMQVAGTVVEADVEGSLLILAPTAAVAITWPDELKKWLPQDEVVVVLGPGYKRKKLLEETLMSPRTTKRRWVVVNLEMSRVQWQKPKKVLRRPKNQPNAEKRYFMNPGWWHMNYPQLFLARQEEKRVEAHLHDVMDVDPWAAIIVDESHRALITHNAKLQGQTQIRAGMAQLPLVEGGLKIAMSGTPMRGKPENLWGTLNWLYPDRYGAYWDWASRWFLTFEMQSKTGEKEIILGGLNESKSAEFYADIKPMMLRRTKKEVRSELPDKLYAGTPLPDEDGVVDEHSPVGHWLEMSPKQARCYAAMASNATVMLESGLLEANGTLAELTRLKQFATTSGDREEKLLGNGDTKITLRPELPSNKFDWLVEFLDSLGINKNSSNEMEEDGEEEIRKVVVSSQFTSVLDLFERELNKKGIQTLKITGKVSTAQRQAAAHRWQEPGGPRVFLLNTMAGGVALTLDAADDLVLLDETFIPDEQEQVEDRIHRVSRLHQVTIHYLRSLGTVEENIALTTGARERLTKLLLDGERGVPFMKKLLTPIVRSQAA